MMRIYHLGLFLVSTLSNASGIKTLWPTGVQYSVEYSTTILTGIPEISETFGGYVFKTTFNAENTPTGELIIRFVNPEFYTFDGAVDPDKDITIGNKVLIPSDFLTFLKTPFKVTYENDVLKEISIEANEPAVVTDIKKGAVFESTDYDIVHSLIAGEDDPAFNNKKKSEFSKMGYCDVEYFINKIPGSMEKEIEEIYRGDRLKKCSGEPLMELIKNKDLSTCTMRAKFNYNYGVNTLKAGNTIDNSVSETDTYKLLFCFSKGFIEPISSIDEQRILMHGPVDNGAQTNVETIVRSRWIAGGEMASPDTLLTSYSGAGRTVPLSMTPSQVWLGVNGPMFPRQKVTKEENILFAEKLLAFVRSSEKIPPADGVLSDLLLEMTTPLAYYNYQYDDLVNLKDFVSKELSREHMHFQEATWYAFYSVLADEPTEPSLKFVTDQIKSSAMSADHAPEIAGKLISRLRTPTESLLEYLVDFLQHQTVLSNENLKYSVLMSLSDLVYRACIDPITSTKDYPQQITGSFCSQNSAVLQDKLIPFLHKSALGSLNQGKKAATPFINALGNLGMKTSADILMQIVGGDFTMETYHRHLAVVKLSKAVWNNPTLFKNQVLALVANEEEDPQVRMAAVSLFPLLETTGAEWTALAKRTWTDASHQVCSYISTMLESLVKLPKDSFMAHVSEKASTALKVAKPRDSGIQTSHDWTIMNPVSGVKDMLVTNVKYFTSEYSAFPRLMSLVSELNQANQNIPQIDIMAHLEGAEDFVKALLKVFNKVVNGKVTTGNKNKISFESLISMKMMETNKLFSINEHLLDDIGAMIENELTTIKQKDDNHVKHGIKKHFLKMMKPMDQVKVIPTISGLPVTTFVRSRLMISNQMKITIKNLKKGEIDLTLKPVIHYSRTHQSLVSGPFGKCDVFAGHRAEINFALPSKANAQMTNAQFSLRLKKPNFKQNGKAMFNLKAAPFVHVTGIETRNKYLLRNYDPTALKKEFTNLITVNEVPKTEIDVGKPMGLDLKLTYVDEEGDNFHHLPKNAMALLLGNEFSSWRKHEVSLVFNPTKSLTKEAVINLSIGYGSKLKSMENAVMEYPVYKKDTLIEKLCVKEVDSQTCEIDMFCKKEHQSCEKKLLHQQRPTLEVMKYCMNNFNMCNQRHISRESVRSVLNTLEEGSAVTLYVAAYLKQRQGEVFNKLKTQITLGQKNLFAQNGDTVFNIKTHTELPYTPTPHEIDMDSLIKISYPTVRWDQKTMIQEDLSAQIVVEGRHSLLDDPAVDHFSVNVDVFQSRELKHYVEASGAALRCEEDIKSGFKLTQNCKQIRHSAASLDTLTVKAVLPTCFTENRLVMGVRHYLEALVTPYLTHTTMTKSSPMSALHMEELEVEMHFDPLGKEMDANLRTSSSLSTLSQVPLPNMEGLLPVCTKDSQFSRLLQKVTKLGAPSSCVIENNRVVTFDHVEYAYNMEECEHLVFKECSAQPRVVVSVRKGGNYQTLKSRIDNDAYEIKISRGGKNQKLTTIELNNNGNIQLLAGSQISKNTIWKLATGTHMKMYEDGVVELSALDYGLTVYADTESVEVKTYQHILRDKACGLCGDLNDEKTGDVKTENQCLMSSPTMAAYSFMVKDTICPGLPQQLQQQFDKELAVCKKKTIVPTKLY